MIIFYGITFLLSLVIFIVNLFAFKKKIFWVLSLFISLIIYNFGYFLLSISQSLTLAIIANDICYLGSVFLPYFMLFFILDTCKIKYPKYLMYILLGLCFGILFIATSVGYLPIYYKEVSLVITPSGSYLEKVYGPLHIVYYFYLGGYLAFMIVAIIKSFITKKDKLNLIYSSILSLIVFGNIAVWLTEQFIDHQVEFLCVLYILNEAFIILLQILFAYFNKSKEEIIQNSKNNLSILHSNNIENDDIINTFMKTENINQLTEREKEVLVHILRGEKRKEIAAKLFISESGVKKHTTQIFKKLNVINRQELFNKLEIH